MNTKMNKLALASAIVLAGVGFVGNAYAAEATAASSATVIAPITITKSADLVFGKFAHGAGASDTVTVSTSGARTASGVILSTIGSTPTAAKFDITGDNDATYSISHGGTPNVASTGTPENVMVLTKFSDLTGAGAITGNVSTGLLGATGLQSIYVGGTLNVSATQVAATDYVGTVIVTVEYN